MGLCQDWHIPLFVPRLAGSPGPGVCPGGACRRGSGAGGTRGGATGRQGRIEGSGACGRLASARRICWRAAWRRRTHAPRRRSSSPASTSNVAAGLGAVAPGREHGTPGVPRGRARCRPLPPGPRPGRGAGHAPAPGALPPRPGHAVCCDRPAGAGPYRAVDGHRDVSAMEMTFWLPETEAALAQVDGAMTVGERSSDLVLSYYFRPMLGHSRRITARSCPTLCFFQHAPLAYAMMSGTMRRHHQAEETRWTLSRWWIRRSPCCASGAVSA